MAAKKVWAVEHLLGVSLIVSTNGRGAARMAAEQFGAASGPYTVPRNQPQAVLWARSRGAKVINPDARHNDETISSGHYFETALDNQANQKRKWKRGAKMKFPKKV